MLQVQSSWLVPRTQSLQVTFLSQAEKRRHESRGWKLLLGPKKLNATQFSSSRHKSEHPSQVVSRCILTRVPSDVSHFKLSVKHVVFWLATTSPNKLEYRRRRSGNIACCKSTASLRGTERLLRGQLCWQWVNWMCQAIETRSRDAIPKWIVF